MGFWDFFRKKSEQEENEKIKLAELQSWLQNKKAEVEKQEEKLLNVIQVRISEITQEFKEELSILRKVDIKDRKAEEKIKLVVRENLENYIYYFIKLINKLSEVNEKTEKEIIEKINSVFYEFEKKSLMSFEKATFLIGKELGNIKESIRIFFKDFENILKENKDVIDKAKIISSVEVKERKSSEIKKRKSEIEKSIKDYNKKIDTLADKIKAKEEEIEKLKKSDKFIAINKKKQELLKKREEQNREIYKLKEMINLKPLANFFHSFEKEMDIIKAYKENFKQAFQRTQGEDIISLFREAKMPNVTILNKIQNMIEKEREIDSIVIEKTEIEDIETEIKEIRLEIEFLKAKKLEEEKRYKKLEVNLDEIVNSIIEELREINVKIG